MARPETKAELGKIKKKLQKPINLKPNPKVMAKLPLETTNEELHFIDHLDSILNLPEDHYPKFTLAKNKARFIRMLNWYRTKEQWLNIASLSGISKLFRQQTKELEGIRSNKLEYEMELETSALTPSQRSYRYDELKMCKVHEKMAVNLISKMQIKIRSNRR